MPDASNPQIRHPISIEQDGMAIGFGHKALRMLVFSKNVIEETSQAFAFVHEALRKKGKTRLNLERFL